MGKTEVEGVWLAQGSGWVHGRGGFESGKSWFVTQVVPAPFIQHVAVLLIVMFFTHFVFLHCDRLGWPFYTGKTICIFFKNRWMYRTRVPLVLNLWYPAACHRWWHHTSYFYTTEPYVRREEKEEALLSVAATDHSVLPTTYLMHIGQIPYWGLHAGRDFTRLQKKHRTACKISTLKKSSCYSYACKSMVCCGNILSIMRAFTLLALGVLLASYATVQDKAVRQGRAQEDVHPITVTPIVSLLLGGSARTVLYIDLAQKTAEVLKYKGFGLHQECGFEAQSYLPFTTAELALCWEWCH